MRSNDAICGLVLILLAAAMIALTATFPDFQGQNYRRGAVSRACCGIGLILCGALLVRSGCRARVATARPGARSRPGSIEPRRLGGFVLTLRPAGGLYLCVRDRRLHSPSR